MKSCFDVVSYSSTGEEHDLPIIFLHGLIDSRLTWKKVSPIISKKTGRKAYALDARNHGDSPRMTEMNYDVLTEDLVEFMNEQEIKKAVIVGNSMGGRTAINFALKHPERTEAIVVEDMTPRNVYSGKESFVSAIFEAGKEILKSVPPEADLKTVILFFMDVFMTFTSSKFMDAKKFLKNSDVDMAPLKKVGNTFVPLVDLDAVAAMLTSNALVQNLPKLGLTFEGDALFLYGSKGFFNLGKDTSIDKLFPRALKMKIEGASHMIHIDSPDQFSEVVSNFIQHRNLQNSKY